MIVKNESKIRVDAITGATLPALKQYLVPNAAYTCYTLWHTAYGVTRDSILSFLEQMADASFLRRLLRTNEPGKQLWVHLTSSTNQDVSRKAFDYFLQKRIEVPEIQQKLTSQVELFSRTMQVELVQRLSKMSYIDNRAFVNFITAYTKEQLDAGILKSVFETTQPTDWNDNDLINTLTLLTTNKNPFVREMAKKQFVENRNGIK